MSDTEGNVLQSASEVEQSLEPTGQVTEQLSWKESLSEDLRGESCLQDFKDVDGLAKSYAHLVKMQGNSIRIPGEDASDESKQEFYNKLTQIEGVAKIDDSIYDRLGRPESPDNYKIPEIDNVEFNKDSLSEFTKLAHEKGLTNDQLNTALEFYANERLAETESRNQVIERYAEQLKSEWSDEFNNKAQAAKAALQMYNDKYPDAVQDLMNSEAGSNPALLNILADHYSSMKEKGSLKGEASLQFGLTPTEAREKIAEMRNNKEISNILYTPNHPDHKTMISKMEGLYKIAVKGK